MQTVALEQAQATLPELPRQVASGEDFTITQNGEPKAKLSAAPPLKRAQPKAGSLPGKIWLSPDFDAPLEDFKDSMIGLPFHYRDPFDRLWIAQAIAADVTIVTHDREFSKYRAASLW
ncbi:MAG: type II toxin-antitoxin system prevent-host-death family antitoxin [Verrucomicrobiota bacterium]|nr:type II toxin-antitoxin system prevent-host-death family antitoxin [Verrucomicrobiota bacterium]